MSKKIKTIFLLSIINIHLAPTHAILAFKRALDELEEEGGLQGRAKR
jgi:aspartate aminotransferase-like enzyme